jgi:tripeptidyl-peptidase-1
MLRLLNDQLLHTNKSPLGFLNPWLYSTAASAMNDITSGQGNFACGTSGFSPTAGWDPVSLA